MTRKRILPLTYPPKVGPVREGKYTQTIRPGRKFRIGDLVMFHGWEGKPYRSKWSFRTVTPDECARWSREILRTCEDVAVIDQGLARCRIAQRPNTLCGPEECPKRRE